jgi:flagellar hook-basal body complex protein FliE
MVSPIDSYRQAASVYLKAAKAPGEPAPAAGTQPGGQSFADMVRGAVNSTVEQNTSAERQAAAAISGHGNLNDVVTAVSQAEVALQSVVAVRDRVIEAYKDIMRMPI